MRRRLLLLLGVLLPACGNGPQRAAKPILPESDGEFRSLPPGAVAAEILTAVDEGLKTPEKGPDMTRFVVVRAADRHPPELKNEEFHVLVGAGIRMPEGSMRIRRRWIASGQIDGRNQEPQTLGISVAVERGAKRPFDSKIHEAVAAFCEALAGRVPMHSDCILAMEEIPHTNHHEADQAERELAVSARGRVPLPATDGKVTIHGEGGTIEVAVEIRDTNDGRRTGMMLRKKFDGENRGMLFVYPHRDYRHFHMRNCYFPIDLAYIREGRIQQVETMAPQTDASTSELTWHSSRSAVRYALEMPGGWFAERGLKKGDRVTIAE
ncbi:MAG: DUF192 domain-containing protein [Planctomycetota bacterium]|jgi:uncharacterized membrane protein (UPF0127 family)